MTALFLLAHTAWNTSPSRSSRCTGKVVPTNRSYELDEYYGGNSGAKVDPALIKDCDILLSFSNALLYDWKRHVEELSGATISILPNHSTASHVRSLRLTGTHLNAMSAFQAYNLDTSRDLTGTVWAILHLDGPWMIYGTQALKRRSPLFLPKDGFTAPADLHISVVLFNTSLY
ncbi:hypothetical protein BJV82DRAFT_710279 [Fennellomyces sp. T-0311]|nr:hypothetical protein BJV82DRAFT_710278 [Fennellomyces sp. T-0311]KAI8146962.1 hypothetical protein BJV82DRAFT_710279 [Fennellomyces sp. T-0311]